MKTIITRYFAAGLLGISLFGGGMMPATAAAPKAVLPNVGSATASVGVVSPGQPTVKPVNQDEITQLNSLEIQSISGNVVTAAKMQQVWCIKAPCPKMPVRLFTISVNNYAILLFRNRTRATLADFAVGDKINVYGFIDGQNMDALIMRDLDKPQLPIKTELHNVEIIGIGSNTLTVQYHFDCKGQICPMGGATMQLNGNSSDKMMPMIYPVATTIQVSANTKFMDRNGNAIVFGNLKLGDILDIWGTTNGNIPNSIIQAQSIRDNSIPLKSATISIRAFSGPGKLQAGQNGQWKIDVTGGNQNSISYSIVWGDEPVTAMAPQSYMDREDVSSSSFTHTYSVPGVYNVQVTVTDANGSTASASMSVYVYSTIVY